MENSKGNKYVWYALQLFIFTIVLYMSKMFLGIAMFTLTTIAILITMYKRDSGICDAIFFFIELSYTLVSTLYVLFVFMVFEGKFYLGIFGKIILCWPVVVNYAIIAKEVTRFVRYDINKHKEICLRIRSIFCSGNAIIMKMEKNDYDLQRINLPYKCDNTIPFKISNEIIIVEIVIAIFLFYNDARIMFVLAVLLIASILLCFLSRLKTAKKLSSTIIYMLAPIILCVGFIVVVFNIGASDDRNIGVLTFLLCVSPINFYLTSVNLATYIFRNNAIQTTNGSALLRIRECDIEKFNSLVECELQYTIDKNNGGSVLLISNGYDNFSAEITNFLIKQ